MMKVDNLIFTVLIFCLCAIKINCQEDTVIMNNSVESVWSSDFNHKREYQYQNANLKEEKTLFKLGASPLNFIGADILDNFNFTIGIEKKIVPFLSIFVEESFKSWTDEIDTYAYRGYTARGRITSFNIGLKYYYSMNKRIKESIGANNFHSNYFSVKLDECIKHEAQEFSYPAVNRHNLLTKETTYHPFICISWGIQRRITRLGFVDAGPYFKFNDSNYGFGLNLLLGLGLGF